MKDPSPKTLVKQCVIYARYRRRSHVNTDPVEITRLRDLSIHNLQLARHIKAAAIKTGSYGYE